MFYDIMVSVSGGVKALITNGRMATTQSELRPSQNFQILLHLSTPIQANYPLKNLDFYASPGLIFFIRLKIKGCSGQMSNS